MRAAQRRPELDGVRAVAIGLVLVNHATGWYIGWPLAALVGRVGVTMFFALSGYLITGILVAERERTGAISLRGFYIRRVARLAPALLLMLAFVAVVFGPSVGFVGALTYSTNWLLSTQGDLGAVSHTWTLAVEEQFYLVWPLVLVAAFAAARSLALGVIVVGVAAALLLPWQWVQYSTPFNAIAIMLGALLALARAGSSWLRPLGPLAPLGRRAYSLYLWNWPLVLLLGPIVGTALTFVAAELSYRLLERPITDWARRWTRDRATAPAGSAR